MGDIILKVPTFCMEEFIMKHWSSIETNKTSAVTGVIKIASIFNYSIGKSLG